MQRELSRREFVGTTLAATTTAMSFSRILGANDRISIGIIGCGDRGRQSQIKDILTFQGETNVEITAVCDPWRQMREQAVAQVKDASGKEPSPFVHYRDLLAVKSVDAVTIATPEHQHCTQLIDAVRGGKDAFVEIKKLRPDLKVLLSSGYDHQGPVAEIMALGADGFIQKPYNMDDLLGAVRSAMPA